MFPADYHLNSPEVYLKEQFGIDRVTICLNWTQGLENLLQSFQIGINPRNNTTISSIVRSRSQITISYNVAYNISVVADFCGQRNTTTILLHYCELLLCRALLLCYQFNQLTLSHY